jgi:hypothetical protein
MHIEIALIEMMNHQAGGRNEYRVMLLVHAAGCCCLLLLQRQTEQNYNVYMPADAAAGAV